MSADTERRARARAAGQKLRAVAAERKAYLAERASTQVARETELEACQVALAQLAEGKSRAYRPETISGRTLGEVLERARYCEHGGGDVVSIVLDRLRRLDLCTACQWALGRVGGRIRMDDGLTITRKPGVRCLTFEPCGCITELGARVLLCTEHV